MVRGWALAEQGQYDTGILQLHQGITSLLATGAVTARSSQLAMLAEAYGKGGRVKEGFPLLAEALDHVNKSEEYVYEAELYRLKGALLLQQENQKAKVKNQKAKMTNP